MSPRNDPSDEGAEGRAKTDPATADIRRLGTRPAAGPGPGDDEDDDKNLDNTAKASDTPPARLEEERSPVKAGSICPNCQGTKFSAKPRAGTEDSPLAKGTVRCIRCDHVYPPVEVEPIVGECPNCEGTVFVTKPQPSSGQRALQAGTVRCVKCSHIWHREDLSGARHDFLAKEMHKRTAPAGVSHG